MIRIGEIAYANCVPIFAALRKIRGTEGVEFVRGEPAVLNGMLYGGEIDLAPASSFEYGLHAGEYFVIPDLSISADQAVKSVLLFSRMPMDQLDGATILLSSASASSNALIQILLDRQFGHHCSYRLAEELDSEADAEVVIGNQALKAHLEGEERGFVYDLSLLWRDFTGLPFVFALWIVRREVVSRLPQEVSRVIQALSQARLYAESHFLEIGRAVERELEMDAEDLVDYWKSMSYDLDEEKISSLKRYFDYALELGLLPASPRLRFYGRS